MWVSYLVKEAGCFFTKQPAHELLFFSSFLTDLFAWQVSKKLEDIRTRYAF